MLVHYDGTRTKLAAEYNPEKAPKQEATNSVQQSIQPINQQASPKVEPKNNKPAAGMQTRMGTPKIYNPTLQRMGIEMPEPRDPREVSTKLSNLRAAIGRNHNTDILQDADMIQTLKPRDYWDSPYMSSRDQTRLSLMAPEKTRDSQFGSNVAGGAGAILGAVLPLAARGFKPGALLTSGVLGAMGYFGGKKMYDASRRRKMEDYRYYLEGNPRR